MLKVGLRLYRIGRIGCPVSLGRPQDAYLGMHVYDQNDEILVELRALAEHSRTTQWPVAIREGSDLCGHLRCDDHEIESVEGIPHCQLFARNTAPKLYGHRKTMPLGIVR
ncbi:hypothetical protein P279_17325 [Rhodobacteraceae bacterium PD-2]|nr:hypothetical protein P279_17325 [Rhodobacteraceae bacterium PD-2]